MSLNLCQFIGHLGRDPETRYLANGDAVTNFSVGVSQSWKDKKTGEKKEDTEWVRCSAFGRLAEVCGEHLRKGSHVYIAGRMATRKWTDKDGVEKYSTEIRLDQMQMLGSKGEPKEDKPAKPKGERYHAGAADDLDDSIPF